MKFDEKRPGGGSGGVKAKTQTDHDDIRDIEGNFKRSAKEIQLQATHWGAPAQAGMEVETSNISLQATGEKGALSAQAGQSVAIVSGVLGDDIQAPLDNPGVTVLAYEKGSMRIRLQLGSFNSPDGRSITIDDKGVWIDAGDSGTINLTAGPESAQSYIQISPAGITISGPLVRIN
jgi:hypothetical protein